MSRDGRTERVVTRMTPEGRAALASYAKQWGVGESTVVRWALAHFLANPSPPSLAGFMATPDAREARPVPKGGRR